MMKMLFFHMIVNSRVLRGSSEYQTYVKYAYRTKINEAQKARFASRRLFRNTWGLQPKTIYWLYTAVMRPIITYGCLVWWQKEQQVVEIFKLWNSRRREYLGTTGAFRSTPT